MLLMEKDLKMLFKINLRTSTSKTKTVCMQKQWNLCLNM